MTSFLIVDAQSVKNTNTAGQKGYDAGKKVSGIKRHIGVDTQGFPHTVAVTTANVTDRKGALEAMDRCKPNLQQVKSVLVDSGYTGQPFADSVQERLNATVQVVKRNELHTFVVLPKRWVVERSFAWLEKCRRLWKNCERKLNTSLQFVHRSLPRPPSQKIVNRLLRVLHGGPAYTDIKLVLSDLGHRSAHLQRPTACMIWQG